MICLWLVDQWFEDKPHEFQGVFDTRELAIAACALDTFYVTRVILNKTLPIESVEREHCWYPLLEDEPMETYTGVLLGEDVDVFRHNFNSDEAFRSAQALLWDEQQEKIRAARASAGLAPLKRDNPFR